MFESRIATTATEKLPGWEKPHAKTSHGLTTWKDVLKNGLTLARSVLDDTFEGLAMNKPWRRQSSAEWAARAIADILAEGKVWSTGWRQLRAHNDGAFRDAVEEAAALHSRDDLFARHIAPDPADVGDGRRDRRRRRGRRAHARRAA